jgi:hypothetical protein
LSLFSDNHIIPDEVTQREVSCRFLSACSPLFISFAYLTVLQQLELYDDRVIGDWSGWK